MSAFEPVKNNGKDIHENSCASKKFPSKRMVSICKHFWRGCCRFGDTCYNSHQPLPLYKKDMQHMVLTSALQDAAKKLESSTLPMTGMLPMDHGTDTKLCTRSSSKTLMPNKSNVFKAQAGRNFQTSTPFCTNRFSPLSTNLINEEDEEKRENFRVEHKLQGTILRFIYPWLFASLVPYNKCGRGDTILMTHSGEILIWFLPVWMSTGQKHELLLVFILFSIPPPIFILLLFYFQWFKTIPFRKIPFLIAFVHCTHTFWIFSQT
jgi:hypothetical protein